MVQDATARICASVWGRGRLIGLRMLAYVTGTVDQELLARNEYLAAGESTSSRREPPAEAFGRRPKDARRDRSSLWSQGSLPMSRP